MDQQTNQDLEIYEDLDDKGPKPEEKFVITVNLVWLYDMMMLMFKEWF